VPDGTLLGRTAAARAIGVSKTTVRRFEGTLLKPEVGVDGVHRFREEELRELVIRRASKSGPPDAYDGEIAGAVFDLLDEGVHPVDVVKRLRLDPRAVDALRRQWASMRDTFIVTGDEARQIEQVPWLGGSRPIRDGRGLLECLGYVDPHDCERCEEELATLCARCAKAMNPREADERAHGARERKNEHERQRRKGMWEREFLPRHLAQAGRKAQERLAASTDALQGPATGFPSRSSDARPPADDGEVADSSRPKSR
jgi:hypothetical protein